MSTVMPIITEMTAGGGRERSMDISSRLFKDRIIFINGEINEELSFIVTSQLLYLESNNPGKPVTLYINSPGGSIIDGLAIYDVMQITNVKINTVVIGQAASMASFLAQAGSPGCRKIMPNARIMVHQPLGSVSGSVSDTEIVYKEMLHYKELLSDLYVKHNSKDKDKCYFKRIMDRDTYFSAEEAIENGFADEIVVKKPTYY